MVLRNPAVEYNVAAFSELSFAALAGKAKQRLVLRVTTLIQCHVVNYSSDGGQSCRKVRRVSAKSGSLSIACAQLGPRKLSVIRSSGVSATQGLLQY